jgi:hypothetical protein
VQIYAVLRILKKTPGYLHYARRVQRKTLGRIRDEDGGNVPGGKGEIFSGATLFAVSE